jgi:predicted aspartyl protease
MQQRGPVFNVQLSPALAITAALARQNALIPAPVVGMALIDTGASMSSIDNQVAASLGLSPIDVVKMSSASHASTDANVYAVHFEIMGCPIEGDVGRAIGAELAAQGLIMLVGRDILQRCTLHYNGGAGQFTLSL